MTEKEKIRAEIERLKHQSAIDSDRQGERGLHCASLTSFGKEKACEELLSFIDSMQEEPKKCMYSKDDFTDEDRKVLCDGCEEECKYSESDDFTKALAECISQAQCNVVDPMVLAETWKDELIKLAKSKEPASEDLEEAANAYAVTVYNNYLDNPKAFENIDADTLNEDAFKAGAQWQKRQIKKSMDLGEPPYLISVEQAYYRTLKLLEE